jgi:peptide/nickel transport system substrate-binding protein
MRSNQLVLVLVLLLCTALLWAGGKQEAASGEAVTPVEGADVGQKEAPMLAELVDNGDLPPLSERLPEVPGRAIDVSDAYVDREIGRYGGTLRMFHTAPGSDPYVFCMSNEPLLRGPGLELLEEIQGNVVRDYEVTNNYQEFVFFLREGMKWSDGEPVTTEDVRFAYEDVLLNEDLTSSMPAWLRSGNTSTGAPMELEIIDDYSFRVTFDEPYGGFAIQLAISGWRGYTDFLKPAHYMKQFHPKYVSMDELAPMIQEEELEEGQWWALFSQRDFVNWEIVSAEGIGFPRLNPWIPISATASGVVLERNPYYWKVDAEGRQLPYIDRIRTDLVQDAQASVLKIISGEVDFVSGGAQGATIKDIPILKENEEKGGYNVIPNRMHVTPADIDLNLTHEDPVWREVVRDVRFRKAVTHALDRDQIIDAVYIGFAEYPTVIPSSYEPDLANRLLDEMGLDKRSADGWRLGPDGEVFDVPFEIAAHAPDIPPVAELAVEFLKAVGLNATLKISDGGLIGTRRDANDLKASVFWTSLPLYYNHSGFLWAESFWGPLYRTWFESGGEEGEEPPEEIKRYVNLVERSMLVSREEALDLREEYLQILHDYLHYIVVVQKGQYPTVVSKKLGNVPHSGFSLNTAFGAESFFYRE